VNGLHLLHRRQTQLSGLFDFGASTALAPQHLGFLAEVDEMGTARLRRVQFSAA